MSRVNEICLSDGKLAAQRLRQVGRQLGAAQAQLAAVGTQSAEQKLANFLLTIADLCDSAQDGEFDMPMRRGMMGDIAGPGRVAQAMSLDAVTANACRLVGPMLGGLLIARGGLVWHWLRMPSR